MFAIQLKNIDKSFGKKKVLNNLSLQIRENEMVALIGPSGCGKTTLLNILGLIEPYDSVSIFYLGNKLHNVIPIKLTKQFVDISLIFFKTLLLSIILLWSKI